MMNMGLNIQITKSQNLSAHSQKFNMFPINPHIVE
jgi:hypothetical protein